MQELGGASDPEESLPRFLAKKSEERWKTVEQKRLAFTTSFSQEVRSFNVSLNQILIDTLLFLQCLSVVTLFTQQCLAF